MPLIVVLERTYPNMVNLGSYTAFVIVDHGYSASGFACISFELSKEII